MKKQTKLITVGQCLQTFNNLRNFFPNVETIGGLQMHDLKEIYYDVKKHVNIANEFEEALKKRLPFKWDSEDKEDWARRTKENPIIIPKRIFSGGEEGIEGEQLGDVIKRVEKDEKEFNEKWDKYLEKKVSVEYIELSRDDLASIKGPGIVMNCLFWALEPFRGNGENKKEK